ncbi:MAG: cysteine hydrolase [Acidobacteria bacterium]|nr:MAG: cysteine hydrolase [Acidobacteriota bacterium]
MQLPDKTALLIIDVQKAIDHPSWGVRNNRELEVNLQKVLKRWRELGWPVFHVAHDSVEPGSTYRPGQWGNEFKPEVEPRPGETIIRKQTNNAFVGTGLEDELRSRGLSSVVICGVVTNNSVEATTRMAGNLGFRTYLLANATATFGKRDLRGRWWDADDVHHLSLANLDGEYASVVTTEELLAAVQ